MKRRTELSASWVARHKFTILRMWTTDIKKRRPDVLLIYLWWLNDDISNRLHNLRRYEDWWIADLGEYWSKR